MCPEVTSVGVCGRVVSEVAHNVDISFITTVITVIRDWKSSVNVALC